MSSVFTKIINRELPGRFVYEDELVVAFLTIEPLRTGHTLVVPREEIEHWIDLPDDLRDRLFAVAQQVGRAIAQIWNPARVALLAIGLDVPHVHLHVTGVDGLADIDISQAQRNPDPAGLDDAARRLAEVLRAPAGG